MASVGRNQYRLFERFRLHFGRVRFSECFELWRHRLRRWFAHRRGWGWGSSCSRFFKLIGHDRFLKLLGLQLFYFSGHIDQFNLLRLLFKHQDVGGCTYRQGDQERYDANTRTIRPAYSLQIFSSIYRCSFLILIDQEGSQISIHVSADVSPTERRVQNWAMALGSLRWHPSLINFLLDVSPTKRRVPNWATALGSLQWHPSKLRPRPRGSIKRLPAQCGVGLPLQSPFLCGNPRIA